MTSRTRPQIYGYCSWHKAYAYGVRVIHIARRRESAFVLYACGGCRDLYGLIPQADRP